MPSLANQIRNRLERCISGADSLHNFRQWLAPISWSVENSNELDAIRLAYDIEGVLAEASSANWSDDELMKELAHVCHSLVE